MEGKCYCICGKAYASKSAYLTHKKLKHSNLHERINKNNIEHSSIPTITF